MIEKLSKKIYFCSGINYSGEIIINNKVPFLYLGKFFGLFCIENYFAKNFAKCCNLLI